MAVGGKIIEEEDVCQILGWWVVSIGERERRSQRGIVCREIDYGLKRFWGGGGPRFRCVSI